MYNNYNDHEEFYSDMSAILASNNNTGHRGYFAIPHLVLQAFDDPISTWRTNAANEKSSVLYPSNLVAHEESSNLVLLLTSLGGHLGWPMGWMPHSWDYMNNLVAAGFVSSYVESVKARKQHNSSEYNE
jgi:predicted alpha/beta-fold hydrolase